MQSINDGSSNLLPTTPNTFKEGPLHKGFPIELHEEIMSYLNNGDTSTLSLITSKLNEKTIHVVKNQEFLKMASFGRILAEKLPDTYKDQKEALSHLIHSDDYKASLDFDKMKEKLDTVKALIMEILLTIPQEDLAKLFDAFKGPKPKLYFDFVPLSEKHLKLHHDLNSSLMMHSAILLIEQLLEGVYANEETFKTAIKFNQKEKIDILSEFGFKPTVNNLNYAIKVYYDSVNRKIEALPIPDGTTDSISKFAGKQRDIDRLKEHANAMIIALLDAGAKPPKETLELAKKLHVDMTIFDKYIK